MGFSIFRFSQINVERRNHHRIKLFVSATLEWADGEAPANFLNVSRDGALVELRRPPAPRERLILHWQDKHYCGICRWTDGRRCGVQFEQSLNTADMAMLLSA